MRDDRAPDTVTEAIGLLHSEGYTADYELIDGMLESGSGQACSVDEVAVERLYRFEGPSDPGDEMIVFGLYDPVNSTRGTLAAAFGHSADPDLYHHLGDLTHRFK